ncbi:MAG: Ig-like domain-containing protein [Mariprofundales bacterium]
MHEQELIAVDDYVDIYGKAAAQIDVLLNDDNSISGQINIISVTPANMGAVLINYDNTLSYIAKDNVSGEDFFSYTISNANGTTASATVFLTLYSNNGDKSEIVTSNLNKLERKLHEKQQLMMDFNPEQFIFDDDYSSSYTISILFSSILFSSIFLINWHLFSLLASCRASCFILCVVLFLYY